MVTWHLFIVSYDDLWDCKGIFLIVTVGADVADVGYQG